MCLQTFKLQHDVLLLQPCWSNELCIRGAKNRCGGQARLWLSQKRAEVLLPTHRGSFSSPDSFMPLSDTSGKRGIHPIASPCPSVVIKWRETVNKWRALKRKERPWWKSKKLLNDRFKSWARGSSSIGVQGKECVFAEPLCPAFPSHKNKNMLMHRYTPLPRFLHAARKPVLPLAPKITWALPGKGFELQAYFLTTWLWALMKKKICQIPNDDFLKIACIWWHFWWVCSV